MVVEGELAKILLLLAFAAAFMWKSVSMDIRKFRTRRWSETEGRVVSSRYEEVSNDGKSVNMDADFVYEAGGLTHDGRLKLHGFILPGPQGRAMKRRYAEGQPVTVRYRPENPSEYEVVDILPWWMDIVFFIGVAAIAYAGLLFGQYVGWWALPPWMQGG